MKIFVFDVGPGSLHNWLEERTDYHYTWNQSILWLFVLQHQAPKSGLTLSLVLFRFYLALQQTYTKNNTSSETIRVLTLSNTIPWWGANCSQHIQPTFTFVCIWVELITIITWAVAYVTNSNTFSSVFTETWVLIADGTHWKVEKRFLENYTYTARLLWLAMWYPITQLLHWYLHWSNRVALVR